MAWEGEGLLFIEPCNRGSRPQHGTKVKSARVKTFSPNLLGAAQLSYPVGKPMTTGVLLRTQPPIVSRRLARTVWTRINCPTWHVGPFGWHGWRAGRRKTRSEESVNTRGGSLTTCFVCIGMIHLLLAWTALSVLLPVVCMHGGWVIQLTIF